MASVFDKMDKDVKEFLDMLNVLLENDEGIEVNSVDDLVKKANKIMKK
ncbi:MAG: hypothetical protein J6S67_09750 [Methanobrevibacter sp.]|nr:hypothetical protein [Methanobrevibacter sp.]